MANAITAADRKALRLALLTAFPGWEGSITADKRSGMGGCYRVLGRVYHKWTHAQWWSFHQLLGGLGLPVRVTGLQAALESSDKHGHALVQLGVEPRD